MALVDLGEVALSQLLAEVEDVVLYFFEGAGLLSALMPVISQILP